MIWRVFLVARPFRVADGWRTLVVVAQQVRGGPFSGGGAAIWRGRELCGLAGCGTGKTLAAWRWAQAQLSQHEIAHVVFLYPTKGTATEGFRDYVAWAPEAEGALVHGSARFELEAIQSNPRESEQKKNFIDETNEYLSEVHKSDNKVKIN
jgi:hypothetical protein